MNTFIRGIDCITSTYFSTSSGVARDISSDSATSLSFYSSFNLEDSFSLADLKYSLKFMATKSLASSSVRIFK